MADTIQDAPPPTVRDEDMLAAVAPAPEPPPKKPMSLALKIAIIAAVGLAVGGAAAFALVMFLRYEPVARKHIPSNANLALYVEATEIALYAPVREHLWPSLEEIAKKASSKDPSQTRIDRIEKATGVRLDRDIREVVVASVDATSWVVVAGGKIEKGRFVNGLAKVLSEEGVPDLKMLGEILLGPRGMAIAQADDGAILVGTDAAIVTTALPGEGDVTAIKLPASGPITFAATKQAWGGAIDSVMRFFPAAASLGQVELASGSMTLGEAPKLELRLTPTSAITPAALADSSTNTLNALRLLMLLSPDVAGEKAALGAAKVEPQGAEVVVTAPWPREGIEQGCKALGKAIRER